MASLAPEADSAMAALAADAAAADAMADIDCADSAADICDSVAAICAFRSALAAGCRAGALAGAPAACVEPGVGASPRGGGVRNSLSPAMCLPLKGGGGSAGVSAGGCCPSIFVGHFQKRLAGAERSRVSIGSP